MDNALAHTSNRLQANITLVNTGLKNVKKWLIVSFPPAHPVSREVRAFQNGEQMIKHMSLESHIAKGFDLLYTKKNKNSTSYQKFSSCANFFTSKSVFGRAMNLKAIQASSTGAWQTWSPQPDITLSSSYSRQIFISHSSKISKLIKNYLEIFIIFRIQKVMLT